MEPRLGQPWPRLFSSVEGVLSRLATGICAPFGGFPTEVSQIGRLGAAYLAIRDLCVSGIRRQGAVAGTAMGIATDLYLGPDAAPLAVVIFTPPFPHSVVDCWRTGLAEDFPSALAPQNMMPSGDNQLMRLVDPGSCI